MPFHLNLAQLLGQEREQFLLVLCSLSVELGCLLESNLRLTDFIQCHSDVFKCFCVHLQHLYGQVKLIKCFLAKFFQKSLHFLVLGEELLVGFRETLPFLSSELLLHDFEV